MSAVDEPPALARLQRDFQHYLLDLDGQSGRDEVFAAHVVDGGKADLPTRIGVYHEAYHLRLTDALAADFGTLAAHLGEARFGQLARGYIGAHPSEHPSVRWFGRHLAAYCRVAQPWSGLDGVADIAALDWAISLAFDAADAPVVDLSTMAGIAPEDWPGMRFTFHPSVRTVDLEWNAAQLRGAHDADETLPAPVRGDAPVRWVVWRHDMQSMYRSMEVDEALSLAAAMDGATFATLCEGLCEWLDPEHAPMHAAGMLKRWLVDAMLTDVAVD